MERLPLSQISAEIPGCRKGKRIHIATITRWILEGAIARNGERVRLPATKIGCRWMVRR